ncbi:glycosyltransferase family 2 protein [Paenibacillus tarimensis]|nr:glycosyltransferase family 2 protein [Paenibacillus tarimensis]MCF2945881.1 glycosyltransferase family 2 protein [Paenibacillus tarimensis]
MLKQDSAPTVSVCIVTYNSSEDIEDCLHAVLQQSFPVESVIVVDNDSKDDTCNKVAQFGPPVQLHRNRVNNGFAGGQNQAISHTDSDYVVVLNPDVRLQADYIREIVSFMEANPQAGSAAGQLVFADRPDLMDSAGIAIARDHNAVELAAGEPASNWSESREVFGVSGAAAVYRMAMIGDISYKDQFFDEDYFAYKEDVDVAWRARHLGWQAWYIPAAKALHRRGWKKGGRRSMPLFVRRHSYQNRFFTLIKNEPAGWSLLQLFPVLIVKELGKLAYILLREPGLLACWLTIIRKCPDMLRKRKWLFAKKRERST